MPNGEAPQSGNAGSATAGGVGRPGGDGRAPLPATRRFLLLLGALVLVALALRVGVVLVQEGTPVSGDAYYYQRTAEKLLDGQGFVHPLSTAPSALHPPGWSIIQMVPAALGAEDDLHYQLFAALLGTLAVALVGFAAREIAGARTGLIAAAIAAVHPNLWLHERTLLAEVPVIPLTAGLVWVAASHVRRPAWPKVAVAGLLCGVLALSRSELALLVPTLLAPMVLLAHPPVLRRRNLAHLALAGSMVALVLAPWVLHNQGRFEKPVLMSTNFGTTLWIANCPEAYSSDNLGHIAERCHDVLFLVTGDESVVDSTMRAKAVDRIRSEPGRQPAVIGARIGRTWSIYRPVEQARIDAEFSLSDDRPYLAGLVSGWALMPFVVVGVVRLRRRRMHLLVLLAPILVVTLAAAMTLGQTRIRAPAEVCVVVLAAVGVDTALRWLAARRVTGGADAATPPTSGAGTAV